MADIWLVVADTVGERVQGQWDAVDDAGQTAGGRLRAVLHAHLCVIQANPGLRAVDPFFP